MTCEWKPTLTCQQAREQFGDDLPRFMASQPTIIGRSYGVVVVTQIDIDEADREIAAAYPNPASTE